MKINKNIIKEEEEFFPTPDTEANEEEVNKASQTASFTSLISGLIKDEWEAVDGYNSAIVTLSALDENKEVIDVLQDILQEEYIHIGQLEKTLQLLIPISNEMKTGEDEAAENIADENTDDVEEPVEAEDPHEEGENFSDDIPEDIAEKVTFAKKVVQ